MTSNRASIRDLRLDRITGLDPRIPEALHTHLQQIVTEEIHNMTREDVHAITQQGLVNLYLDPDTHQYHVTAGIGTWAIASRCLPPQTQITVRCLPERPDNDALLQHALNEIRLMTASPRTNEAGCLALLALADNGQTGLGSDSAIAALIGVTRQTVAAKRRLRDEQPDQTTEDQPARLGLIELNDRHPTGVTP